MALFIEEDAIKVMKSSLSTSTRSNYISSLIRFIVWIFDNISASLLTPHFFTKLQAADVQDNATGKPNKIRKHIRKAAKQQLNKMNEDPSTHPIILKNLTFQIITTYFFTFKRRYTKKIVRGEELVQACTAPQHNPGEVITIRHGGSSFDRLSSALTYLFNECHVPKDVNEQVCCDGYILYLHTSVSLCGYDKDFILHLHFVVNHFSPHLEEFFLHPVFSFDLDRYLPVTSERVFHFPPRQKFGILERWNKLFLMLRQFSTPNSVLFLLPISRKLQPTFSRSKNYCVKATLDLI
jgi:hypothetical protein